MGWMNGWTGIEDGWKVGGWMRGWITDGLDG